LNAKRKKQNGPAVEMPLFHALTRLQFESSFSEIQVQKFNASEVGPIESSHAASSFSALADSERANICPCPTAAMPCGHHAVLPNDTHWTRILHCDLFTGQTDHTTATPGGCTAKDPIVPTHAAKSAADARRTTSPIPMIVVLYALCLAMYLAIGGIVQAVVTRGTDGVAPADAPVAASVAPADDAKSARQRLSPAAPDQDSDRVDISHACGASATAASMNLYD
jgi:hypothetical protein